uniref:Otopetrin-1 n=1 Tax=Macrostomum lignano TaxID=282301 RepID=A0A1I8G110_9PLAT
MDSVRPKSNDTWQQSKSGQFQQRRRRVRKPSHLAFTSYQDGSTRLSMLQSLLTLYCMLALMLGVVVPITDALAQPEEHAEYRQIFYIFMHAVGIVGIVYMNSLISYYGSNYYKRICKSKVDKKLVLERDSTAATSDATESVDPEHSTALVSRNGISADEVLRPGRSTLRQIRRRRNDSRRNSASGWFQRRERIWKLRRTLNSGALAAVEQEKIILSGVGVNLYLRFGAIIFGFGVMMHSAFKIVDSLSKRGDSKLCLSPWFLPKHIIDLLFIVLQTYFLFKHHKKSLIRFFLIHLAVANLCIWIKTVVYEIKTGLMHSTGKKLDRTVPNAAANFTTPSYGQSLDVANELLNISNVFNIQDQLINDGNGTARNSSCTGRFKIDKNSPSAQLGPYLYPCAVEYGLICAAICYKFFTNVGNTEAAKKSTPVSEATALPRSTTCHKSHRGLFGGLIVTICVLVPMVSLLIARQQANSEYRDLHVIAMLIIECV